nr:hypothetical protein [uncultured Treponema sp.]
MAKVGVKNSGQGNKINLGREHAYLIKGFTTPNKLFNDSKKMKNATVILDPGEKTDVSFSRQIVKPTINDYIFFRLFLSSDKTKRTPSLKESELIPLPVLDAVSAGTLTSPAFFLASAALIISCAILMETLPF